MQPGSPPSSGIPPEALRQNALLAALSERDLHRICALLSPCIHARGEQLYHAGDTVSDVHFPGSGLASFVAPLPDGSLTEVMSIGRDGVIGVLGALGWGPIRCSVVVQADMPRCFRMSALFARAEMARRTAFHALLQGYSHAVVSIVIQTAACNARHSTRQRMARWLLLAQDRLGPEFDVTQESMAMMLGVTRQTVALLAGRLQHTGAISYRHGRMVVRNRRMLQSAACECYGATTALLAAVPGRISGD